MSFERGPRGFFRVKIGQTRNGLWFGRNVTLGWWVILPAFCRVRLGLRRMYASGVGK